ncbi:MAG TPA: hypothetical protein VJP85_05870 [Candidatus Baltobacteraceae bacterium]|nr:hypothetical protein [Candidatus Baltobacteraceae bacterium]
MLYRAVAVLFACTLTACASHGGAVPSNVAFGAARPLPAPAIEQSTAAPRILAMRFSGEEVHPGDTWSGTIVTSTNVASVEVRTNLFSIDVPRRTYGDFRFALRIYDVPPIFIRAYRLRVIARNAAGQSVEEDLPFRIR